MKEKHAAGARMLRFAVVGLGGAALNAAILFVLHGALHWPLPPGVVLSTECAIISNIVWNDRWTFGERETSLARLARFNLSSLGGLTIALGSTAVLVGGGVPYLPADLVGIVGGAVCNFALSMLWTWRPQPQTVNARGASASG